jgi:hypothetical protein
LFVCYWLICVIDWLIWNRILECQECYNKILNPK